jgi:peptidoglycan pentaglycine glycine transferase (the first glycine)
MADSYTLHLLSSQRDEWDAFVIAHPYGHFLQSWGWGELKTGANWTPLRLVLREGSGGDIVAGAQVLQRTVAHIPARVGHLAYIPKGPVVDWCATTEQGENLASLFLSRVREYLRVRGALAVHVEPELAEGTEEGQAARLCLKALGFHETQPVQPLRTIVLDLRPQAETLLAQMKEKWRYNLRLAARKGVEVRVAQTMADLAAWYALLKTTGERDHFGIHAFDYYRRVWEIFAARQQARLFLAYADEELLAGIFVSLLGKQAIYLYGASGNAQRNLMPNYLLQWKAISWARDANAQLYDFWGIPATENADEAMAGVYRFKSGWGGQVVQFVGNYEYVCRPLALEIARKMLG